MLHYNPRHNNNNNNIY